MMSRIPEASPRFKARLAGVFYLVTMVGGVSAALLGSRSEIFVYAGNLVGDVAYAAATLLLYQIFKPVNRGLSLLAALFSLAGIAVGVMIVLGLVSSPVHPLVFFGVYCLLMGYLIVRSTFMPRVLGAGMAIAGLGWLTFLYPPFGRSLFSTTMILGIVGEGALIVWLLVKAVDERRWNEQAARSHR
jgi:hypothetical protein